MSASCCDTLRLPPGPVVEVTWVDSVNFNGWRERQSLTADYASPKIHFTSGYLVSETEEVVAVAQSFGLDTNTIADIMMIPRAAVRQVETLRGMSVMADQVCVLPPGGGC